MFKEGETFIPDTLGFKMICNLPKSWILDCRSESKIVQLQMVHEFNSNGYIYTQTELKSGKNYKIIMKKAYKISIYHNDKMAALGSITEAQNITEKDIEPKSMDLTREETKALHFHEGHGPHIISTKDKDQNLKFAKFCNSIGHHNPNPELASQSKLHVITALLSIITILQGIGLGIILFLVRRLRSKSKDKGWRSTR